MKQKQKRYDCDDSFSMEDQACPRCKTTKYRNPSLKLMINICGHTLCESCVDLLFLKGSGSCLQCGIPLRRNNFRLQMFDDPMVEKEIDIRKRILKDYNKREEDFETLQEYNDYLEEIELLIYNLCNDIDVINTNKRIEQYKKENREVISKNRKKMYKEEDELSEILELEKQQQEIRRLELQELEEEAKRKEQKVKKTFIDELITSNEDASKIVNAFSEKLEKNKEEFKTLIKSKLPVPQVTEFSTGIKFTGTNSQEFLPIPKFEGVSYVHNPPEVIYEGPVLPKPEELKKEGYMKYIRNEHPVERAGGFVCTISLQRALHDAYQGLYYDSN